MTGQCNVDIYYDILYIVSRAQDNSLIGKVIPSQVATFVNLPHHQFQRYLKQLVALEMINISNKTLGITDKGLEFLGAVKQRNEILRHFGLEI
jgi:predicted transcriptional regulator